MARGWYGESARHAAAARGHGGGTHVRGYTKGMKWGKVRVGKRVAASASLSNLADIMHKSSAHKKAWSRMFKKVHGV